MTPRPPKESDVARAIRYAADTLAAAISLSENQGAQLHRIEEKIDSLTAIVKSQQLDQAKIAELEQKMEAHTQTLKEALKPGQ